MSDDSSAAAAAAAAAGAGTATLVTEQKPVDIALAGGGTDDGGDDTGGQAAAPTWREDWREAMSGKDEQLLGLVKRYASPENFARAFVEQRKRLSAGQYTAPLSEGATEQEIAAYHKANGIPEKPDGYGFAFPETLKPTEADNAVLTAFAEHMHAQHVPPGAAKAAFDFYTKRAAEGRAAREEFEAEANNESILDIRQEYGRDFKRNMKIAEDFLAKNFEGSEQGLDLVMNATLSNGVKVKNFAPFIKGLVQMARSVADDEALIGGDGASGGKSLEDEKAELITKSIAGKLSKSEDARLNQIYEQQAAREARNGRAQAA